MTTVDTFDAVPVAIQRDRWNRPLVMPPGGPKPVPYTRCTTFVDALDDKFNLQQWEKRMVALGLADRPDLLLAVAAHRDDKKALNRITDQAKEAAAAGAAATTGTAEHTLTERIDRGQPLGVIPAAYQADLDAYREATKPLRMLEIEQFLVYDSLRIAGTCDRVAECDGWRGIADIKGLALNTPIPTPDGWSTIGELQVGDTVFGSDGQPCTVTAKSLPKRIGTFIVTFDDGAQVVCDTEHIWWTQSGRSYDLAPTPKPIQQVIDTITYRGQKTHRVPMAQPLELPDADLPIEPYLLGCWLGDGHQRDGCITKTDDLFAILAGDGQKLGVRQKQPAGKGHVATRTVAGLNAALHKAGLRRNKHVPAVYLRASRGQRLRLLQGLMDTDGTWNTARQRAMFTSTDKGLALAVEELACTLGQRPHFAEIRTVGFGKQVTAYCVEFLPVGINPFRLPRKAVQVAHSTKPTTRARRRVITSVEPGPNVPTACIAVDSPDRTYLCGERMIPTHNTGSIEWGLLKIAMQEAVYAHCVPYNPATHQREPRPYPIDTEWALVIHLPAGQGRCELHWINIADGWEAVQDAARVRNWRARKGWLTPFEHLNPGPVDLATGLARASTVDALRALWTGAVAEGILTDEHLDIALRRKAELEGQAA